MVWVVELIRSMPSDHLPKTNDMGSRHEIGTSRVKVPRHLHVLIFTVSGLNSALYESS